MIDGGRLGLRKHTIHGLTEFDVTAARQTIRQQATHQGEPLSFSAFFLFCLGQAIETNKRMHAYRNWRNQLVVFDEVDVNMLFEVDVDGKRMIRPHILRGVNNKSLRQLHDEIRAFQRLHTGSRESNFIDRFVRLPGFIRRAFLWALFKDPQRIKALYGTVMVSSIGMFGTGGGWGLPVPNHSLQITLGGISHKPAILDGQIVAREYLCVTISVDHDLIDGVPAARFTQRLKELIKSKKVLSTLII
jgi:pyruvate/2-oxoglutarate dehydrogenase complex dihydrolipoamide acyltransferase (E2) component